MKPDVPLLIPEINADHLALLESQEWAASGGGIVTNPNCSTVGLAMVLAPLHREFGIESCVVTTMQALSGAGYPGVPSLDGLANVIPFIDGEEEKIEREPKKILGTLTGNRVTDADFPISVSVNRVPVRLTRDHRATPRVFLHWPSTLAGDHLGVGAEVLRAVIGAQLRATRGGDPPTRGDNTRAELQPGGDTF